MRFIPVCAKVRFASSLRMKMDFLDNQKRARNVFALRARYQEIAYAQ